MHVCIRQGGAAELHVPEPDEDALEAPAFDHIWTIKVAFPCFLCLSNFLAECHRFSILRGGQPPDHSFAASCSMLIWILSNHRRRRWRPCVAQAGTATDIQR